MFPSKSALNLPLSKIFFTGKILLSWIPDEQTKSRVVRHIRHPKVDDKKYNVSFRQCIHKNSSHSQNCISSSMFNDSVSITFIYNFRNGQLIAWWELWLRFLDWEFPSAMFYIINIFLQTGCQSSLYRPLHNKTLWKKK